MDPARHAVHPPTLASQHGEMENIKAYVKFSEIMGREPTLDEFVARLRDVGFAIDVRAA